MRVLSDRCQLLVDHLDLEAATGVGGARWEHFQLAHLCDDSTFRIEDKSRQIAWSWTVAAEGIAEAVLEGTSSIYVSINLTEAVEKIRYARLVYESLHGIQLPALTRDNELGLEFSNGARLTSHPATPPRGRSRSNVYLDEFAHVQHDREIYTAALPVISKGGRLRIGSSPLGASGVFWEVYAQSMRLYPGFKRKRTPWWETYAFCVDPVRASIAAPGMPTAERVERFGNGRIQSIQGNMLEEDFAQEYECDFVDESTAWITWEEIKAITAPDLDCFMVNGVNSGLQAIDALRVRVPAGRCELVLTAGVDVGRTRNTTELYVVGISPTHTYPLRLAVTLDNTDFDDQLSVLVYALRQLPIARLLIDQNGIGRNLAESAAKAFPAKVVPATFTNATKALWATDAKMLIQQRKPLIPANRDLAYQIHSIKRHITPSKNMVFDTEANEKHHADRWWAWVLALSGAKMVGGGSSMTVQEY